MTKIEFKYSCYSTVYTGGGKRINAIFFDWKSGDVPNINRTFAGYKYMAYANVRDIKKKDLFNAFYDHVNEIIRFVSLVDTSCVHFKTANTDEERFKVPLSLVTN